MKAFFLILCCLTCATTLGACFALILLGLVHLASIALLICAGSAVVGLFIA